MRLTLLTLFVCHVFAGYGQENLIERLMKERPAQFERILADRNGYEIQIIYTQIDRDPHNKPSFKTFTFNEDPRRYFYPASTVKFPLVLMALEKLRAIHKPGLDKYTDMLIDSVDSGHRSVHRDTSSRSGYASIGHEAVRILVVSDNDAYNRLYEFLGQEDIAKNLSKKGYRARIIHRLERPLTMQQNASTEAIRFLRDGKIVYTEKAKMNQTPIVPPAPVLKGKGYIKGDSLVRQPFDFTYKNFFPLMEQHMMLLSVVFPSAVAKRNQFNLTKDDRNFVLQYMSQLPTETLHPPYALDTTYSDAYCKFLMFGGSGHIPEGIRIFNKVGDAYGYLIDNAYIVDFDNKVEFMLSAVIHVNADGIYNDGRYEYDEIGLPFMKNLGQLIYDHELARQKRRLPDLTDFKFKYDKPR